MIKNIIFEINSAIDEIIKYDLLHDVNYPIESGNKICWSSETCLSSYFDTKDFYTLYKNFLNNKEFTVLFKDGSLVQISYECDKKEIVKHRLFYFNFPVVDTIKKNTNIELYDDEPLLDQLELFCEYIKDDRTYIDIQLLENIGFLRFDYDKDAYKNIIHPATHLSINQEGVRIPVNKPLTPHEFFNFILSHYKNIQLKDIKKNIFFKEAISSDEKKIIHINI